VAAECLNGVCLGRRQPKNVFPEGEVLARRNKTRREEGPGCSRGRTYVGARNL